jgi:hypothetical protein
MKSQLTLLILLTGSLLVQARRVTLITHGLNENAASWVLDMANSVQEYQAKLGASSDLYLVSYPEQKTGPLLPQFTVKQVTTNSTSPEKDVVIAFDWSFYAQSIVDIPLYNNTAVGPSLAWWLGETNVLPGITAPLVQSYLHLIGHSRGGSLVCGTAGLLSDKGFVVSQLTTLDPRPYGAFLIGDDYPLEVAPLVLFADNYYQSYDVLVYGLSMANAYNRKPYLADELIAGQPAVSDGHTNIRDWYQRTIKEWDLSQFSAAQQQLYRNWFTTNDAGGTSHRQQPGALRRAASSGRSQEHRPPPKSCARSSVPVGRTQPPPIIG